MNTKKKDNEKDLSCLGYFVVVVGFVVVVFNRFWLKNFADLKCFCFLERGQPLAFLAQLTEGVKPFSDQTASPKANCLQ